MKPQRSPLKILLGILLGFGLGLSLHACQAPPPSAPTGIQTNPVTPATVSPAPPTLPPETAAIVASAGPQGLYKPPRGEVRLAVISDLNGAYGSTDYDPEVDTAVKLLPFWQPDLVVCSGDMVAGQNPILTEEQIKAMWAAFDEHVAAPLRQAKLPYGFTLGNHDASSARSLNGNFLFQRERNQAAAYWQDPAHDPGIQFIDRNEFPFYYTFEHKDVFFLVWDGSSNQIPAEKLAWVEKALASPQAQAARIRILLGHLPLYAVAIGRNEPGEVMENADRLREILERGKVHTYISGHHHSYYPAHKGKLQLLHMGILGSGPRPLIDGTPPRKAMTVIDIKFDSPELTTYTTYDMETLQLIQYEDLPRFLAGHNGMVMRRDVENLTATERSQCESQLSAELCSA